MTKQIPEQKTYKPLILNLPAGEAFALSLKADTRRATALHADLRETVLRGSHHARQVYGAREVFEHDGLKAQLDGGDGREPNAEVEGDACEKEAVQATFAQVAG
jgi:hypothetical protein